MPVLVSSPPWRWVIGALTFPGSGGPAFVPITFLDKRATKRSLRYTLNAPAQAVGTVFGDDPEVNIVGTDGEPFVAEGTRCLWGFRREGADGSSGVPWVVRFAGLIMQIEDLVESDIPVSRFTAFDPWQGLFNRAIRKANGSTIVNPGPAGLKYTNTPGNQVALDLLQSTIDLDGDCYIDLSSGSIATTDSIDISFQQTSSVGAALQQLCATNSMDIVLTPIYDPVGRPGKLCELNIYQIAGSKKPGAIFAWDLPSRSLSGIDRMTDGTKRANEIQYFVPNNLAVPAVTDSDSIAKYGRYVSQQVFPVQASTLAVEGIEAADLLIRKDGIQTIRVDPVPERSPIPFVEYFLGDSVHVAASKRLRQPISGYWRVYEIPIDLSDDSLETVSQLDFSLDNVLA